MTGKVLSLNGAPSRVPEVDQEIVEELEGLLERAKSGAVLGVTFSWIDHEACACYRIVGRIGSYSLLGAAEMARADLTRAMLELNDE